MISKISTATISFTSPANEEIERILATDPPKIVGEFDLNGKKYPILASQPIPHGWTWGYASPPG
jgi:hypothetical protein